MRRLWVFLLLLASCSDTGKYRLSLVLDHPDVVEVEVWALEPGEQVCDDYLSHLVDPGSATVLSSAVFSVPPQEETLGDVPAGETQFVAEGRTATGAKILRGCTRYNVKGGANNYITIELAQVCWPVAEDLQNQQDDDCDTLVDECDVDAECDDSDDCTVDTCDQATCVSVPKSDGSGCDDGDDCTDADICTGGTCAGTPIPDCCVDPCDDGLYCTEGDQCVNGSCTGTARDCDDADDCTIDTCDDDVDQCVNNPDPVCYPPPVRSNGQPTGVLPSTTRVTTLSLDTDIDCTCRWSTAAGTDYDSMTGTFSATGGMQHAELLIGLEHGTTYDYHVRCRDPLGATNDDDYTISFVVSSIPTPIFRSVGPRNNTALATGSGNVLAVAGSTATFAWPLPGKVGVGDVIQYDSDDDGVVDAVAFIYTRLSGSEFRVKDVAGGIPVATQVSDEDWAVFRAYVYLDTAEDATENTGLDDALQNFDTWTTGRDLVTSNEVWNIACYADAPDNRVAVFSGWTTGPANYLRIYTPVETWEVGISQRHDGKWSTSAYRMTPSPTAEWFGQLRIAADHVEVEGLQFYLYTEWAGAFGVRHDADDGQFWLSDCIIRGSTDRELGWYGGLLINSQNSIVRIWNNIVYDFDYPNSGGYGIRISDTTVEGYIYNNTVYEANECYAGNLLNSVLMNNIGQACGNGYASWNGDNGATDYNISNRAGDWPGANSINDATVLFANESGDDFHLDPADTTAVDLGTDLSGDAVNPFLDDIDGDLRSGAWDIGADEL